MTNEITMARQITYQELTTRGGCETCLRSVVLIRLTENFLSSVFWGPASTDLAYFCIDMLFVNTHLAFIFLKKTLLKRADRYRESSTSTVCSFITVHYFCFSAQQPNAGQGRLILDVYRSNIVTHHVRQDSSRLIISTHRPLSDNTLFSQQRDRHSRRDSNSQSQQTTCLKPVPLTVRPLESATIQYTIA